jgi:hypothetical protein
MSIKRDALIHWPVEAARTKSPLLRRQISEVKCPVLHWKNEELGFINGVAGREQASNTLKTHPLTAKATSALFIHESRVRG